MGMNSVLSFLWLHSCCVILAGYSLMEFTSVIKIFKLPNRVALLLHRLVSLDSFNWTDRFDKPVFTTN